MGFLAPANFGSALGADSVCVLAGAACWGVLVTFAGPAVLVCCAIGWGAGTCCWGKRVLAMEERALNVVGGICGADAGGAAAADG